MPPQIGDFISQHVYGGQLKSNPSHVVHPSAVACRFVDVDGCEQLADDGNSSFVGLALVMEWAMLTASCGHLQNEKEVEAIVLLARYLQDEGKSYRIITPYDAQRSELERALQAEGLNWHDKCFNVDSFQGHFFFLIQPESLITDMENRQRRPHHHHLRGPFQRTRILD